MTYISVATAVATGMIGVGVLGWYAQTLGYPSLFSFESPLQVYAIVVLFLLIALPVGLLIQFRLLSPVLITALAIGTWVRAEAIRSGPSDPFVGLVGFVGPVSILLMLVVAGLEFWSRQYLVS